MVMVPDPQRVGSHWLVLDMASRLAVFSSVDFLVDILLEFDAIILGGYGGTRRTNLSCEFPGYGRIWLNRAGRPTNILLLSEISLSSSMTS